jgi:hypothetical protein
VIGASSGDQPPLVRLVVSGDLFKDRYVSLGGFPRPLSLIVLGHLTFPIVFLSVGFLPEVVGVYDELVFETIRI